MAVATLSWPGIRVRSPISSIAFLSLGEELDADLPSTLNSRKLATGRVRPDGGLSESTRPGFPAFTDRLWVAVHVDLFQLFYAIFYSFSRSFIFFLGCFEQWPEKRQRKDAPVEISQRRFQLYFGVWLARRCNTDRQSERDSE